jgi:hypothetical protein
MKRSDVLKAVCLPVAVAVGVATVGDADNPHIEQKLHEEEPVLTYDTPYTTTSGVVATFPLLHDFPLKSVRLPVLRVVKK